MLNLYRCELAEYRILSKDDPLLLHLRNEKVISLFEEEMILHTVTSLCRMSRLIDGIRRHLTTARFHVFVDAVEHIMCLPHVKNRMLAEYYDKCNHSSYVEHSI